MEYALRYHIRKHFDEDPAHYTKLSEKLDQILAALKNQWEQLALALSDLVDDVLKGLEVDATGLDPRNRGALLRLARPGAQADTTAGRVVQTQRPPLCLLRKQQFCARLP